MPKKQIQDEHWTFQKNVELLCMKSVLLFLLIKAHYITVLFAFYQVVQEFRFVITSLKKLKASPFQKSFKGKWEHLEKNTTLIEEFPLVVIIGLDDLCFQSSWLKQTTSISNCFIQDSLHSSKMRLDHLVSIMIIIDLKTQHYQKHLFGLHVECGPRNISDNF